MRKNLTRALILTLALISSVFGQARILHQPPRDIVVSTPVLVEALIEGNSQGIKNVKIFFREAGQETYFEASMNEIMGIYKYNIPARVVTENGLEYLIVAEFSDGSMAAFPETDPYNVPMFVTVKRAQAVAGSAYAKAEDLEGGIPSNAIILGPDDGQVVAAQEVVIAVSLFNARNIALNTVKVEIDGLDITSQAQVSEDLITVRPSKLLAGLHSVKITFSNQNNVPFNPLVWSFTVVSSISEAERVLSYNGNVIAETNSETVRGIEQKLNQLRTRFSGAYDWLNFEASMYLTDQEDPNKQPRNRYSAGFSTNYFKIGIGDVNPQFAEFGIKGKRVRGVNARLMLKYFNLHVVYGETERAIKGTISDTPDTLSTGVLQYGRSGYTFSRNLLAVRPYFGSGQNFQLGLYFLKAVDDTISVAREMQGILPTNDVSIAMQGTKPQDNLVVGTDLLLAFDNKRFTWMTEAALSMLNRDISSGALTKKQLDTFAPGDTLENDTISIQGVNIPLKVIPIDPADIANIFIINKNIAPLLPFNPDTGIVFAILNMPSSAFRTALTLNYFNNYVVLKYQRVGPEFYSLGNPYMRNDVQGFSLSDRIRLFQNRVFLTLNFEQYRDNLNDQKRATTTTTALNAGISLYLGENLPTINLNTMQYSRKNDLTTYDTTWATVDSFSLRDYRESNMTIRQDIRIEHRVEFLNIKNTISLNYANSDKSDRLSRLPGYQFSSMSTSMLGFSLNSKFPFPLKTNIRLSTNKNESGLADKPLEFMSFGMQGEYDFFGEKLGTLAGYNLTNCKGQADFTQHNMYVGAILRFLKVHQLRGYLSYTNINDRTSVEKFNDVSFYLTYSLNF